MKLMKSHPIFTFNVPEGVYRAKVVKVRDYKEPNKGKQVDMVRLVFELYDESGQFTQYRAGKNYIADLNNDSDLWFDLVTSGIVKNEELCEYDTDM
jgi:hypothetical protein